MITSRADIATAGHIDTAAAGRVSITSATAALLSTFGHVAGGGSQPTAASLAIATGLAAALAVVFARREWTFGRLLAVLGGAQVAAHALFSAGATGAVSNSGSMALAHAAVTVVLAGLLGDVDHLLTGLSALLRAGATRWLLPGEAPRPVPVVPTVVGMNSVAAGVPTISPVLVAPRRGPPV